VTATGETEQAQRDSPEVGDLGCCGRIIDLVEEIEKSRAGYEGVTLVLRRIYDEQQRTTEAVTGVRDALTQLVELQRANNQMLSGRT